MTESSCPKRVNGFEPHVTRFLNFVKKAKPADFVNGGEKFKGSFYSLKKDFSLHPEKTKEKTLKVVEDLASEVLMRALDFDRSLSVSSELTNRTEDEFEAFVRSVFINWSNTQSFRRELRKKFELH
ncbi:MAG: hypothetical protein ABH803_00910 [Candidatus Micrarchaeota archaeon]